MKTRRTFLIALLALFFIPATISFAADKGELQKRFKARYPQLLSLMKSGVIGETEAGFVDFVKSPDPKHAEVVNDENSDRRELYAILAKETSTSADVVAERAAKRNIEKLANGMFYRESGAWKKKGE